MKPMLPFSEAVYLWGVLLITPIWLIIFVKGGHDSRRDMIFSGLFYGALAVLIAKTYALADYWHPPYLLPPFNIEDFLYGFFYGGIASELFERFVGYTYTTVRTKTTRLFLIACSATIIIFVLFFLIVDILRLNSIVAHILPLVGVFLLYIFVRRDLLIPALLSGVVFTLFTLAWIKLILVVRPTAISEFWKLENLSGVIILGIPIEEYLFAFALGVAASGFYELITGGVLKRRRR